MLGFFFRGEGKAGSDIVGTERSGAGRGEGYGFGGLGESKKKAIWNRDLDRRDGQLLSYRANRPAAVFRVLGPSVKNHDDLLHLVTVGGVYLFFRYAGIFLAAPFEC